MFKENDEWKVIYLLRNRELACSGLGLLRQVEPQDAVFKRDLDVVRIDVVGQPEAPLVGVLFVLAGTRRLHGDDVLFDLYVQVFFLDAREFDFQCEAVFDFVVVGLRRVGAFALGGFGVEVVKEVLDAVESGGEYLSVDHNFTSLVVGSAFYCRPLFLFTLL